MRDRAAAWAQGFSLEGLKTALQELLRERWKAPLKGVLQPIDEYVGGERSLP